MICPVAHVLLPISELVKAPFFYPATPSGSGARRLVIEIGPGRGDFLFHLAEKNPDATVVGTEIKRKRVDKLIARTERRGLKNIRIIQDDAREALPRFFKDESADEIHINFPDPWPKKRHSKNRAVNRVLLAECLRVIKKDGTISITTDSAPYAEEIASAAAGIPGLKSLFDPPIAQNCPDAFPTFFALKWQKEGRRITYQRYGKH